MGIRRLLLVAAPFILSGCAGIQFGRGVGDDAFTYYEPQPYLSVKQGTDCTYSVEVISLPGKKRSLKLKSGLGSAKLSVKTANGIITEIGQETDTKVPETITALTGLAKQIGVGAAAAAPGVTCPATVSLYEITTVGDKLSVATSPSFKQ